MHAHAPNTTEEHTWRAFRASCSLSPGQSCAVNVTPRPASIGRTASQSPLAHGRGIGRPASVQSTSHGNRTFRQAAEPAAAPIPQQFTYELEQCSALIVFSSSFRSAYRVAISMQVVVGRGTVTSQRSTDEITHPSGHPRCTVGCRNELLISRRLSPRDRRAATLCNLVIKQSWIPDKPGHK